MSVGRFMGMVGALIWCHTCKKYLILKRSEEKDFASNIWECGTGRVDQGETITQGLLREVKEELGVDIHIDFIIGVTHFFRGEAIPENEMLGVYFCCSLEDPGSIQLSWEHSEYRWVTPQQAADLLSEHNWLTKLIRRAEKLRSLIPVQLIKFNHQVGFEW